MSSTESSKRRVVEFRSAAYESQTGNKTRGSCERGCQLQLNPTLAAHSHFERASPL